MQWWYHRSIVSYQGNGVYKVTNEDGSYFYVTLEQFITLFIQFSEQLLEQEERLLSLLYPNTPAYGDSPLCHRCTITYAELSGLFGGLNTGHSSQWLNRISKRQTPRQAPVGNQPGANNQQPFGQLVQPEVRQRPQHAHSGIHAQEQHYNGYEPHHQPVAVQQRHSISLQDFLRQTADPLLPAIKAMTNDERLELALLLQMPEDVFFKLGASPEQLLGWLSQNNLNYYSVVYGTIRSMGSEAAIRHIPDHHMLTQTPNDQLLNLTYLHHDEHMSRFKKRQALNWWLAEQFQSIRFRAVDWTRLFERVTLSQAVRDYCQSQHCRAFIAFFVRYDAAIQRGSLSGLFHELVNQSTERMTFSTPQGYAMQWFVDHREENLFQPVELQTGQAVAGPSVRRKTQATDVASARSGLTSGIGVQINRPPEILQQPDGMSLNLPSLQQGREETSHSMGEMRRSMDSPSRQLRESAGKVVRLKHKRKAYQPPEGPPPPPPSLNLPGDNDLNDAINCHENEERTLKKPRLELLPDKLTKPALTVMDPKAMQTLWLLIATRIRQFAFAYFLGDSIPQLLRVEDIQSYQPSSGSIALFLYSLDIPSDAAPLQDNEFNDITTLMQKLEKEQRRIEDENSSILRRHTISFIEFTQIIRRYATDIRLTHDQYIKMLNIRLILYFIARRIPPSTLSQYLGRARIDDSEDYGLLFRNLYPDSRIAQPPRSGATYPTNLHDIGLALLAYYLHPPIIFWTPGALSTNEAEVFQLR